MCVYVCVFTRDAMTKYTVKPLLTTPPNSGQIFSETASLWYLKRFHCVYCTAVVKMYIIEYAKALQSLSNALELVSISRLSRHTCLDALSRDAGVLPLNRSRCGMK